MISARSVTSMAVVAGLAIGRRRKASRGGFPGAGATGGAGSGKRANAGRGDPHMKAARMMAIAGLAALLVAWGVPTQAGADVTVNFDAVNTGGGMVAGSVRDNYLAGYGITLSHITPGTDVYISDEDPPGWVKTSSPPNVLRQLYSDGLNSYRMNFASPLEELGFTRVGLDGDAYGGGISFPEWTVSAYNSSGVLRGSAHEDMRSYWVDVPPATFTLYGPDIAYAVVASDTHHFAAFGAVLLDDFVVPEPATLCLLALGGLGMLMRRRTARR